MEFSEVAGFSIVSMVTDLTPKACLELPCLSHTCFVGLSRVPILSMLHGSHLYNDRNQGANLSWGLGDNMYIILLLCITLIITPGLYQMLAFSFVCFPNRVLSI